jgi:hypothetical protein
LPEFQQPLIAQEPNRPEHGVGVHPHDGGEMTCWGQAVARLGFAVGDRAADLRGYLLVEEGGVVAVDLDI